MVTMADEDLVSIHERPIENITTLNQRDILFEDGRTLSRIDHKDGCSKNEDGDLSLDEEDAKEQEDIQEIKHHPSYMQVMLDVNRCAGRLEHIRQFYLHRTDEDDPPDDITDEFEASVCGTISNSEESLDNRVKDDVYSNEAYDITSEDKNRGEINDERQHQRKLKKNLAKLIVRLLIRKPHLHYYQGFHDVCLTYMTIYGEKKALNRLNNVIDSHFSAFMQATMIETQEFLALIPIILSLKDNLVSDFLEQAESGTIFALSWVITWFSHVIPNERHVETIFTYLEKEDSPYLVLYLCAEIVCHKKDDLLRLEPEMSAVHHFLCQVPRKESLPIENLLHKARMTFERWSPEYLKQRLDEYRRKKLQVQNYNIVKNLAQRYMPTVTSIVTSSNSRTAIIVFVVASALAFQLDRWTR